RVARLAGAGLDRVGHLHRFAGLSPRYGTALAGGIPRLVYAALYRTIVAGAAGEPGRRRTTHRAVEPAVSGAAEIALGESAGGAVDCSGDDLCLQRRRGSDHQPERNARG